MADKLYVSGARGPSFMELARQSGAYGALPTDSDDVVATKFGLDLLDENPGIKGDPGSSGEGYATRSALALAGNTATNQDDAYLTEPGYENKFVFSTDDLSAEVAADEELSPGGRNYIPKQADPTGASGTWVSRAREVFIKDFGLAGDGVSSGRTTATIQAAMDYIAQGKAAARFSGGVYSTGVVSLGGYSAVEGRAVVKPSGTAFSLQAGEHKARGIEIDGSAAGSGRGWAIPSAGSGPLSLSLADVTAANLTNGVIDHQNATGSELSLNLDGVRARDVRHLFTMVDAAKAHGRIVNCDVEGVTRLGVKIGSNFEVLQRGWTGGLTHTGNRYLNLQQSDTFSTYFLISYLPYTNSVGNIYKGMYQNGSGDCEGEYGKSPFSNHNSNIYVDAGTGEGFLNLKGHGWPEATFATKADAMAVVGTLNAGALIEITADESQSGSPLAYYQVNSGKTDLVIATGAHGHNRNVVGSMFHCTAAYKALYPSRSINGVKVNTDDVVLGDLQFYGGFRAAVLTAGGQTVRNLRASNILFRGGATPANSGAIQLSAPLATNTILSNVTVADNPLADALQIAGGEDGADYLLNDFLASGTARGVALRPTAADTVSLTMRGGRIADQSTNAFYLHNNRLKKLVIEGVDIDHAPGSLWGGNNKLLLDFVFRNNELRPITTTNNTITEYARFPVPYGGGLLSTFKVVATDGTDIFAKEVRNLHQNVAGTVSLIGAEEVISSHASSGASSWACAVSVVTDTSGAQMVRMRVTGENSKTIKWKLYADLEGVPA